MNAIVKHRHCTGAYGDAHFELSEYAWGVLRAGCPASQPRQPWETSYGLDSSLSIPIVLKPSPGLRWELVETSTGEVIHEGEVEIMPARENAEEGKSDG